MEARLDATLDQVAREGRLVERQRQHRLVRDVGQFDGVQLGQRVVLVDVDADVLAEAQLLAQIVVAQVVLVEFRFAPEADVDLLGAQRLVLHARAEFVQRPRHARILGLELFEQTRYRPPHRRADDAHPQPAHFAAVDLADGVDGHAHLAEELGRLAHQRLLATVSSKVRVVRVNRRTPNSLSSFMICWLSGGCEICSRSAARLKLFSSATARKYFNCFRSMDMAFGGFSKVTAQIGNGINNINAYYQILWSRIAQASAAPARALFFTSAILVAKLRPPVSCLMRASR